MCVCRRLEDVDPSKAAPLRRRANRACRVSVLPVELPKRAESPPGMLRVSFPQRPQLVTHLA